MLLLLGCTYMYVRSTQNYIPTCTYARWLFTYREPSKELVKTKSFWNIINFRASLHVPPDSLIALSSKLYVRVCKSEQLSSSPIFYSCPSFFLEYLFRSWNSTARFWSPLWYSATLTKMSMDPYYGTCV